MHDSSGLKPLLQWLQNAGTYLHPSLCISQDIERGSGIRIMKHPNTPIIEAEELLASTPVSALLSAKTSSLAGKADLQWLPPNAELAVHLLHEICLGSRSRWHTYLRYCGQPPDLPFTWSEEAKSWVKGTELEELAVQQWEGFDKERLQEVFDQLQEDSVLQDNVYEIPLSLDLFVHAFCLVQSRAFGADAYHGLSMVPLADLSVSSRFFSV